MASPFSVSDRQAHLEYHNSPIIPDLASEFDADSFSRTIKEAHVNVVTLTAKCHHGLAYFPTRVGHPHPALKGRDLLGEQLEALHRADLPCRLAVSVGWDEEHAFKHPEWRQIDAAGRFGAKPVDDTCQGAGNWRFMNWLHPDYQDFLEALVREILDGYSFVGIQFETMRFAPNCCWSEPCREFREQNKLEKTDQPTQIRFETLAFTTFAERFRGIVDSFDSALWVEFSGSGKPFFDSRLGISAETTLSTLASSSSVTSAASGIRDPHSICLDHWFNQREWVAQIPATRFGSGDFANARSTEALEFDCFRAQALGGRCNIIDPVHPRGKPDGAVWDLIARAYRKVEAAAPYYAGSEPVTQIGICLPYHPSGDEASSRSSLQGAMRICTEAHYSFELIDDTADLDRFELVVLPDQPITSPWYSKKLARYYESGGRLLLSYRSAFDPTDRPLLRFLPIKGQREVECWPNYWRVSNSFFPEAPAADRVFFERGLKLQPSEKLTTLVERVLPYFQRNDLTFSSHAQTPPRANADPHPAAVAGDRFIYFADPVFLEYARHGNSAARDVAAKAIQLQIGRPAVGDKLPPSMRVFTRRRGRDLLVIILHYLPLHEVDRSDTAAVSLSLAGHALRVLKKTRGARLFPSGAALKRGRGGAYALPGVSGRALIEIPEYFGQ